METSINIDVATLDIPHRQALEEVFGQPLTANQRIQVSIIDVTLTPASRAPQTLGDWTNVYDRLSDEEIEEVDKVAKIRANLSRPLP